MNPKTWTTTETFGADGWKRLKENTNRWWAGDLDRPLIAARIQLPHGNCPTTGLPYHGIVAQYPFTVPLERVIETWDWHLRHQRYLGDAFPAAWMDFGASFISALTGGELTPAPEEETTWIHPLPDATISQLHYRLNPDNPWHKRYEAFCRIASDYWRGKVQLGYCTGGLLDSISMLIGPEPLLFAMSDEPEEVLRAIAEAEVLSWHYYHLVHRYLSRYNPGFSCWAGIFSEKPYQILVCDFCCNFGPQMFQTFAQHSLVDVCAHMSNSFFHLDGPGALKHLDALLAMKDLTGIQWVPGAGETRPWDEWIEVIARILEGGKRVQLSSCCEVSQIEGIDRLIQKLGTGKGLTLNIYGKEADQPTIEQFLERHHVI